MNITVFYHTDVANILHLSEAERKENGLGTSCKYNSR
jgi:hypothetical protein